MHFAVAKRFIEKNDYLRNADKETLREFYWGSIQPDITDDKEATHFGTRAETRDIGKRHAEKVNPQKFLQHNKLDNAFNVAVYLHLLTDYEFYNKLLPKDYMKNCTDFSIFVRSMIHTRQVHDPYLVEKHGLSLEMSGRQELLAETIRGWQQDNVQNFGKVITGDLLYSQQQLDAFIEKVSSVNIPFKIH